MVNVLPGLGRIKGSNPETFIYVLLDMAAGTVKKMAFMSEAELREWLGEKIYSEVEINLIIEEARKNEVL
jgi:hypothetical protein